MSSGKFKQNLFDQFARIGKALSSGARLEILEFLAQGERSVEALAKVSGLSVANTSQHLQRLRQTGLVTIRKEGQRVFYSLPDNSVIQLLDLLRKIAENNLAEVERLVRAYLKTKDELEPVPAEEALKRAKKGLVTIIDVRPPEEFKAGHIPGAINAPLKELGEYAKKLDRNKEIVAYCRGPYCVLAFEAVEQLRLNGFKASRIENGFPEWKSAGLPVETG